MTELTEWVVITLVPFTSKSLLLICMVPLKVDSEGEEREERISNLDDRN